jgi:NNP family nitrate/nitrite transporter-like MFS transporter
MACGGIYALVPFVDRKVLGGVTGIVGAGGNIGGVAAGFLLRGTGNVQLCFFILGCAAIVSALGALAIRFSLQHKEAEQALYDQAIARRSITATPGSDPAMA